MTIDLADRRSIPEAGRLPERLSFKVAESDPTAGQTIGVNEDEGIVTAIVSVTGIVDDVDDIIVPGAYKQTLLKRRPKVCWAHAWEHPVGRVLFIEEMLPGDKRLPTKTRDGHPWPKDAGALVAAMQFNLRSDEGKQAFEAVRFYSETGECEWSIGYNVPPGASTKNKQGIRLIKMLDLYELSVVLFGAHPMTGTLSIKQAIATIRTKAGIASGLDLALLLAPVVKAKKPPAPPFKKKTDDEEVDPELADEENTATVGDQPAEGDQPAATANAQAETSGDSGATDTTASPDDVNTQKPADAATPFGAAEGDDQADPPATPDFSDGVMIAVYPDEAAASAIFAAIAGPDDTTPKEDLHVTLAYLGNQGSLKVTEQALNDMVMRAVEDSPVLTGTVGGIGMFPPNEDSEDPTAAPVWVPVDVPGLNMLREQIVGALGDLADDEHGFTPHITVGWGIGQIAPIPETPVTFDRVSVVVGNARRDVTLENHPGNDDTAYKSAVAGPDAWYLRFDTGEVFVEAKRKLTDEQRKKKPTLPGSDTAWPIGDATDLDAAIQSFGRAKDDEKAKVKRWIVKRARELGALSHLPDSWNVKKSLVDVYDPDYDAPTSSWLPEDVEAFIEGKEGGADRNRGGAERLRRYWLHGEGAVKIAWGTPGDFTRCAAELGKYMGDRAKGYCANRHKEATGMWPGDHRNKSFDVPEGAKMFPTMPGSYQERLDLIRQAITALYEGETLDEGQHRWINMEATWDDHVVYTMEINGPDDACDRHSYMAGYYQNEDGSITVNEPEEVQLEVVAVDADGDESDDDVPLGDAVPYADLLNEWTGSMKAAVAATLRQQAEGKAGRVLSGANERALTSAFQHLANVLAAAGIVLDGTTPENPSPKVNNTGTGTGSESDPHYTVDPRSDMETTSPDATIKSAAKPSEDGKTFVLDPADFEKSLEAFEVS